MDHDLYVAILTLAGALVLAGIVFLLGKLARLWKVPKRVDRLEAAIPHLMNVLDVVVDVSGLNIRALQGHKINGELTDAQQKMASTREEYRKFVNQQSVSRPERKV